MPRGVHTFAKFNDTRRQTYLQLLRDGQGRTLAARESGVSDELVRQYRHANPDFAAAETLAEEDATDKVENALHKAALAGNVTACQVWLYNRRPGRWKDMRHVTVKTRAEDLSDDELATIARGGSPGVDAPPGADGAAPGAG